MVSYAVNQITLHLHYLFILIGNRHHLKTLKLFCIHYINDDRVIFLPGCFCSLVEKTLGHHLMLASRRVLCLVPLESLGMCTKSIYRRLARHISHDHTTTRSRWCRWLGSLNRGFFI